LKSAHHELSFEEDAVTESICFHCQQAVEKYLKAYLIFLEIPFKKTHEIGELILLCETKDTEIGSLEDEADILTDYAVASGFPSRIYLSDLVLALKDLRPSNDRGC
jgi:HEPN domain-containing protein